MIPALVLVGSAIAITFVGAIGAYYFKLAAKNFSLNPLKLIKNKNFLLAAFFYLSTALAYVTLLRFERLSIVYPLMSIQYVWVAIFSYYFLDEKISLNKLVGILSIMVGISIIAIMRY